MASKSKEQDSGPPDAVAEEREDDNGEEDKKEDDGEDEEENEDDDKDEKKKEDVAGDGEEEKKDSPSDPSVSLSDYQAILSIVEDFEKDLECPVCLTIPREVPIPSCPAGHIICKTCKPKVQECPTCKRDYPPGKFAVTSSLAASLIDKVPHRCKYQDFKCGVKRKLSEIVKHEKICPERTVKCPKLGCNQEIQLKKFHEHVFAESCAVKLGGEGDDFVVVRISLSSGYLKWDGVSSFRENNEYDLKKDISWRLLSCSPVLEKSFYLSCFYFAEKRSFVFCVIIAEGEEVASKYNVTMTIDNPKVPRKKLTYEGPVLSMDQISSVKYPETLNDSWCVQYEAVKPLFYVEDTSKNNNHVWDVKIPFRVEVTRHGLEGTNTGSSAVQGGGDH